MIIVTGATGFIGSCFINYIYETTGEGVIAIDWLGNKDKWKNLMYSNVVDFMHPDDPQFDIDALLSAFDAKAVVHIGNVTDPNETDMDLMWKRNVTFSRDIISSSIKHGAKVVYLSDASVYGATDTFSDGNRDTVKYTPLTRHAWGHHQLDLWTKRKEGFTEEASVVCLRPFSVYGPNELHKGRDASFITKNLEMFSKKPDAKKSVTLFSDDKNNIQTSAICKDRVYVKDLVDVIAFFLDQGFDKYGIYNVGTGVATDWQELTRIMGSVTGSDIEVLWAELPDSLRESYQYYTKADTTSLSEAGYTAKFRSLEEGISDYWTSHWQNHPDILKGYWGNQTS